MYTRPWTQREDTYLRQNYMAQPYKSISQTLNRSPRAIGSRRMALDLPPKMVAKYPVNEHYFDAINTHERAYFLGLLAADGWVGPNSMRLGLKVLDTDIVRSFRDIMVPGKRIHFNAAHSHAMLDISISPHLYHKLAVCYGIIPRRKPSFTLPENLATQFIPTFYLGYYDGDGGLSQTKRGHLVWNICSGLPLMTELSSTIFTSLGFALEPKPHSSCRWLHYLWAYSRTKISALDGWLHQSGLGMRRKSLAAFAG